MLLTSICSFYYAFFKTQSKLYLEAGSATVCGVAGAGLATGVTGAGLVTGFTEAGLATEVTRTGLFTASSEMFVCRFSLNSWLTD